MKKAGKINNPYQYGHFLIRLLLGVLVVCSVPALLLPSWSYLLSSYTSLEWTSVAVIALSFVMAMLNLRRLNGFPGRRSLLAGIPLLGGWFALFVGLLLSLRLPYSVAYLALGFGVATVWLVSQAYYLRGTHQLVLAYIPIGRMGNIEDLQGAKWVQLEEPVLPEGVAAIVADLHAPDLGKEWQKFLAQCTLQRRLVYNIRQVEEALSGRVKIHHMYENNLGSLLPSPMYMTIKHILECVLIIASLPLTLPIMLVTAVLIKLEDGGSVFYNQERVGQGGEPFKMYKFRSMTQNKAVNQETTTSAGDARITKIGRFIRKVRIDELPQFFNVLKGDMALSGPRAEFKKFADELEQQVPFYQYRHIVKPGITGWAQVMHGYATGADETQIKIEHDFYYIKYFSLWLDVFIVFKTIRTMLTGFGAR